ncbi:MAG: hypothetical protein AAF663_03540 [Planctomycetota bacterium]
MMIKAKFLKPWRGYGKNAVADLQPELASQLAKDQTVELIGGPPALADTPPKIDGDLEAMRKAVQDLTRQLQAAAKECAAWKARAEKAEAELVARPVVPATPPAEPPEQTDTPAVAPPAPPEPVDATKLFTELKVSDATRAKMAAAGWRTVQDVIDFGDANGGLQAADGIGKVTEGEIVEAIKEFRAAE